MSLLQTADVERILAELSGERPVLTLTEQQREMLRLFGGQQ
jgi:hypothetical protein